MMHLRISIFLFVVTLTMGMIFGQDSAINFSVIPAPNAIQISKQRCSIQAFKIKLPDSLSMEFAKMIYHGIQDIEWAKANDANVHFSKDPSLEKGSYRLHIEKNKIEIRGQISLS